MLPHPRTALLSVLGILGIFPFVTVAAPVDVAKRDDPLWGRESLSHFVQGLSDCIEITLEATYFEQDGALGACGTYSQDSDYIVAISEDRQSPITPYTPLVAHRFLSEYAATIYDPDDQMSWLCFQNVTIQNTDNGQYVQAMIVDSCT